jgi:hypothetical protein
VFSANYAEFSSFSAACKAPEGLILPLYHQEKMNIMFAQAILQKESMRCGFVTGHDRGTLWVACRKMPQNKGGLQPLWDLSFPQQPSFYLHRALCRSKLDIHPGEML